MTITDLRFPALWLGFSKYTNEYDLIEISCTILADPWLTGLVNRLTQIEAVAPGLRESPDAILEGVFESMSHADKCALKNRVMNRRYWERVAESFEERRIKARIREKRKAS